MSEISKQASLSDLTWVFKIPKDLRQMKELAPKFLKKVEQAGSVKGALAGTRVKLPLQKKAFISFSMGPGEPEWGSNKSEQIRKNIEGHKRTKVPYTIKDGKVAPVGAKQFIRHYGRSLGTIGGKLKPAIPLAVILGVPATALTAAAVLEGKENSRRRQMKKTAFVNELEKQAFKNPMRWLKRTPKKGSGEYPEHIPLAKSWWSAIIAALKGKGNILKDLDKNVWNR